MKTIVFEFENTVELHQSKPDYLGYYTSFGDPIKGIDKLFYLLNQAGIKIVIQSHRAKSNEFKKEVECWLSKHNLFQYVDHITEIVEPCIVYVSSNAIRFDGDHSHTFMDIIRKHPGLLNNLTPCRYKDECPIYNYADVNCYMKDGMPSGACVPKIVEYFNKKKE